DLIGARSEWRGAKAIAETLRLVETEMRGHEKYQIAALNGLQTGLSRIGGSVESDSEIQAALGKIPGGGSAALLEAAWKLSRILKLPETEPQRSALAQAKRISLDAARSEEERVANIRLLALGSYGAVADVLFELLSGVQLASIQSATVTALQQFSEAEAGRRLVEKWSSLNSSVRPAVINLLLRRRAYHAALLDAIESGTVKLGELNLDLEQRRLLLRQSLPEIQARAAKFFGDEEYSNRKALVEEWLKKLPESGHTQPGRAVFEKACAQCHVSGGLGQAVGPDLSDMSHRSVEDLLSNILDPNMAINPGYASSNVELDNDEFLSGIVQSESAEAITLLQAQGVKLVIPRKRVRRLESSGLSLMPEGLEAGLTPAEMRDLIAFLQAGK
ncbi:MAG: c-type cytochrome, partial [Verrucomicrobia bacterium]|nr:c-type cytochrome [Verrucomicrobiota bacterium]